MQTAGLLFLIVLLNNPAACAIVKDIPAEGGNHKIMKNIRYRSITMISLLLFAALFAGCGGKMDPRLEKIQGHWVDLNSSVTLDISGATMRYTSGEWREKYPFVISETNGQITLVPPKGKNFGPMSDITVEDDGSLTTYEQVLDAEGHRFRFLREEEKAELVKIQDFSEDLPKQINSKDIMDFSLNFYKDYDGQYGLDEFWPNGRYSWTVEKREGFWKLDLDISGESYIVLQLSKEMDQEWMEGLAALLNQESIAGFNGYHQRNEVDRHDWSLWVKYASGEKLSMSAEGDAAETCVFDLAALMDYARQLGFTFAW